MASIELMVNGAKRSVDMDADIHELDKLPAIPTM